MLGYLLNTKLISLKVNFMSFGNNYKNCYTGHNETSYHTDYYHYLHTTVRNINDSVEEVRELQRRKQTEKMHNLTSYFEYVVS